MTASNEMIECPFCHKEFALSEAFQHQRAEEMASARKEAAAEFEAKLTEAKKEATENAAKAASEAASLQIEDFKERLKERDEQVAEFGRQELELRKKQRELEEKAGKAEIENARKLDAERASLLAEAQKKADDDYRLKQMESEKVISDMKKQIDEMKRKAEQGSMQTQGEVVELELEDTLKAAFPLDDIQPVGKGVSGADVIQKVKNKMGQTCGSIIWESKQTKAWTEGWVAKLKDDQRAAKADIAIITSHVLPKDITGFGPYCGIWVTEYASAIALAVALRAGLEEVAIAKLSAVGKNEKMEAIYNYLSGTEFKQKVEGIVEAFTVMKQDLEKEKKSIMAAWAKRDKQIDRVVLNTVGMYGDLQGIIGASLPQIEALEMNALEDGTDE